MPKHKETLLQAKIRVFFWFFQTAQPSMQIQTPCLQSLEGYSSACASFLFLHFS
jgi:hypothetical protein